MSNRQFLTSDIPYVTDGYDICITNTIFFYGNQASFLACLIQVPFLHVTVSFNNLVTRRRYFLRTSNVLIFFSPRSNKGSKHQPLLNFASLHGLYLPTGTRMNRNVYTRARNFLCGWYHRSSYGDHSVQLCNVLLYFTDSIRDLSLLHLSTLFRLVFHHLKSWI
jgi:hypothetical protein